MKNATSNGTASLSAVRVHFVGRGEGWLIGIRRYAWHTPEVCAKELVTRFLNVKPRRSFSVRRVGDRYLGDPTGG